MCASHDIVSARTRDSSLVVEVPTPAQDSPRWGNVGIIAVLGFAAGIIWPKLLGIELGPNPPSDVRAAAAAASARASAAAVVAAHSNANAAALAASIAALSASAPLSINEQTVVVAPGVLSKCKDKKGDGLNGTKCGELALDPVILQPLTTLAKCPSAMGLSGKIPLTIDVDFARKAPKVSRNTIKHTSLPTTTVNGILTCAEKALANVSLDGIQHEHSKYTVVYNLTFYPPGKAPAANENNGKPDEESSEKAQAGNVVGSSVEVAWNVVLVRDAPKTGNIVGRVLRGTKVKVVQQDKDWYKIEFAPQKDGWVFRGAIGL